MLLGDVCWGRVWIVTTTVHVLEGLLLSVLLLLEVVWWRLPHKVPLAHHRLMLELVAFFFYWVKETSGLL